MGDDWKSFDITTPNRTPYSDWRNEIENTTVEGFFRSVRITGPASFFENISGAVWSPHYQAELDHPGESETIIAHIDTTNMQALQNRFTMPVAKLLKAGDPQSGTVETEYDLGPLVASRIYEPASITASKPPKIYADKNDVIMSIIDDTIGFANTAFRKCLKSSRIEALWIMDANKYGENSYGTVLYKRDIDKLLCQFEENGRVDERALYREMQRVYGTGAQFLQKTTHGTHVLDLMTGSDLDATKEDGKKVRDQQPIIAVILPGDAIKDSSGTQNEHFVEEAAKWIVSVANKFIVKDAPSTLKLPLMTNFSFGLYAGPHDGTSKLEKAISAISDRGDGLKGPLSIPFLPAGNGFQSQTHAVMEFNKTTTRHTLNWRIPPDNKVSSFIEIWLPNRSRADRSNILLSITTPDGKTLTEISEEDGETSMALNRGWEYCPDEGDGPVLSLRTYHQSFCHSPEIARERVMIAVLPTQLPNVANATIPAGDWKVQLDFIGDFGQGDPVIVDAWIQRGGSVYGQPRLGRQSIFTDSNYRQRDAYGRPEMSDNSLSQVRREGTWNALATSVGAVSVGGYRFNQSDSTRTPSPYSGAATRRHPSRQLDVAVVTERGASLRGIFATDTISGSQTSLSGSSMACPQVARFVANAIQNKKVAVDDLQKVKDHLKRNATRTRGSGGHLGPLREGAGRLQMLERLDRHHQISNYTR